jgi:crotonyl-CoA carboxylase/reductase
VTRWKPGDEVVIHCNQASYEDPEVHGLDPLAAPSQRIWGYETTWGSFAQFTKVQAQQLLPKPKNLTWEEAASYGLVYFTAYRMLIDQATAGRPPRADLGRRRRPRRVRHAALQGSPARVRSASSPPPRRASCQAARRRRLHRPQRVRGDDAQGRRDARGGEGALQGVARASASASRRSSATQPDIVFEHVGQATFPTSVLVVKPFGKVVICGGTSGYNLDFDVRYLWMRQKQIIGSHFANAYECTRPTS